MSPRSHQPRSDPGSAQVAGPRPLIRARPRAGPLAGAALGLGFALIATVITTADAWLPVRGPLPRAAGAAAPAAAAVLPPPAASYPITATTTSACFLAFLGLGLMYTAHLRRSHRGALLRTQAITLALLLGITAVVKLMVLLSGASVLVAPVTAAAVVAALAVDLSTGIATALAAPLLVALQAPFAPGSLAVLGVQGLAAVLLLCPDRPRRRRVALAGAGGGLAAGATYLLFHTLSSGALPLHELEHPLRSPWLAAMAGGPLGALLGLALTPPYQFLLGDITHDRLVDLADLSHPLLEQIATNSPGTWQHSLAMANMAEIAANAVGASGRLVRVGAYYHDLGKSLAPRYFIENLAPGEPSPHDHLSPEESRTAIFAHVTEGVRLARKHRLPERIIDFMYMHHGNGLLEYFWAKCQAQGNPQQLGESDFRYPGLPPQSRETAILAICDAVEAASRTLKSPDPPAIAALVQRIVYGKLHLGQLDQSGLSAADLRKISDSLMQTIRHAHHGRIEYPWQRAERGAELDTAQMRPDHPAGHGRPDPAATQDLVMQPRLDSLDAPSRYWRPHGDPGARAREIDTAPQGSATIRQVAPSASAPPGGSAAAEGSATTVLRRPASDQTAPARRKR